MEEEEEEKEGCSGGAVLGKEKMGPGGTGKAKQEVGV